MKFKRREWMMKLFFGSSIYFFNLYWICNNITSVLCLFLFFWPWGIWDLSSLNKDQTHDACIGRWGLHRWTIREVPVPQFFILGIYPEVELLSHMRILFLILKDSSYSFPQWLYHFIFPLRMQKSSIFSTSSPTLICLFLPCHMACLMLVPQPEWNLGHL